MMTYHDYVKGPEESLFNAKKYAATISTAQTDQTITALFDKLAAKQKQIDTALEHIITMMKSGIPAGGSLPENPTKQ